MLNSAKIEKQWDRWELWCSLLSRIASLSDLKARGGHKLQQQRIRFHSSINQASKHPSNQSKHDEIPPGNYSLNCSFFLLVLPTSQRQPSGGPWLCLWQWNVLWIRMEHDCLGGFHWRWIHLHWRNPILRWWQLDLCRTICRVWRSGDLLQRTRTRPCGWKVWSSSLTKRDTSFLFSESPHVILALIVTFASNQQNHRHSNYLGRIASYKQHCQSFSQRFLPRLPRVSILFGWTRSDKLDWLLTSHLLLSSSSSIQHWLSERTWWIRLRNYQHWNCGSIPNWIVHLAIWVSAIQYVNIPQSCWRQKVKLTSAPFVFHSFFTVPLASLACWRLST